MQELGLSLFQGAVEERLAGSVRQVLLASYDVAYTHPRIVHDRREVVGRGAVGLAYNEVLDTREADLTPQNVPEGTAPRGRPEVQSPAAGLIFLIGQPRFGEAPRGLVVERAALTLPVRPFVERQAEPTEIL